MWQPLPYVNGVEIEVDELAPPGTAARLSDVLGLLVTLGDDITSAQLEQPAGPALRSLTRYASTVQAAALVVATAVTYRCTLDDPPEDIFGLSLGTGGDMIHQCYHDDTVPGSPHCWDGSWRRIPCPPAQP